MPAPALEVADIFRQHGPAYRRDHSITAHQRKLMWAIENCRTPAMGGVVESCDHCQFTHIRYRSCRNRHCPKCQGEARLKWIEQRQAELLPVPYFHVVFTIPAALAAWAFYNQKTVYDILFRAASRAVLDVAANPKRLGVESGFFAVLHTWGQNLHFHPHLHCVIPGGGLSADQQRWIAGRRRFWLPVKVLSARFRTLFLQALEQAHARRQLQSPAARRHAGDFAALVAEMRKLAWVVFAKPPFGGPQYVIEYLGRYTHRVAISNRRLLALDGDRVSFQWKDYRQPQQPKVMTVSADEFIRRFLQHTLPPGFQRIRYFGFLANRQRASKLALCRRLLTPPYADLLPLCDIRNSPDRGAPLRLCPHCRIGVLARCIIPPSWQTPILNTS